MTEMNKLISLLAYFIVMFLFAGLNSQSEMNKKNLYIDKRISHISDDSRTCCKNKPNIAGITTNMLASTSTSLKSIVPTFDTKRITVKSGQRIVVRARGKKNTKLEA